MDFGGKGYKIFGPDGHTFDKRWLFLYRESANNYNIFMTILGFIADLCTINDHVGFDGNLRIYIFQSYNSKKETF